MTGIYAGLKLTMAPATGKFKTVSAWAFGNGPKVVKKKQKITVKLKNLLNIANYLLRWIICPIIEKELLYRIIKDNTCLGIVKFD
jgi:hypothetical protein